MPWRPVVQSFGGPRIGHGRPSIQPPLAPSPPNSGDLAPGTSIAIGGRPPLPGSSLLAASGWQPASGIEQEQRSSTRRRSKRTHARLPKSPLENAGTPHSFRPQRGVRRSGDSAEVCSVGRGAARSGSCRPGDALVWYRRRGLVPRRARRLGAVRTFIEVFAESPESGAPCARGWSQARPYGDRSPERDNPSACPAYSATPGFVTRRGFLGPKQAHHVEARHSQGHAGKARRRRRSLTLLLGGVTQRVFG